MRHVLFGSARAIRRRDRRGSVSWLRTSRNLLLGLSPVGLAACSGGVLDPVGPVGAGERIILLDALAIMLAIVVPTILVTFFIIWKYRASNTRARYLPDWSYSGRLELLVWSVPALVVLFLGGIAWIGSHDLDPGRPLAGSAKPIEIEVVSLDWKWLFIYPEQHLASVNRLVVPAGVPLHFRLTSASVMNSFFVPQLGSQIYTMAGMATQLNLQADTPGRYAGLSGQFSGDGFSDMRFTLDAVSEAEYGAWLARSASEGPTLDIAAYRSLAEQSAAVSATTYRAVDAGLFDAIVMMRTSAQGAAGESRATVSPAGDERKGS